MKFYQKIKIESQLVGGIMITDVYLKKKIISEMKNMDFSQDLVLYAVLQKYDTPNKNGRIYPEAILKRENEDYD